MVITVSLPPLRLERAVNALSRSATVGARRRRAPASHTGWLSALAEVVSCVTALSFLFVVLPGASLRGQTPAASDPVQAAEATLLREASPTPVRQETPAGVLPDAAHFHLYLLMGQSNMVGRDLAGVKDQVDNPRVLALNPEGRWVVAREPMHAKGTGMGPGIPFARAMLEGEAEAGVTIGLIPCAVGGTPLRRWVKGGDLYEQAVARARVALQSGTLKGVLWHQGESDSSDAKNAGTYGERLQGMIRQLRSDLGLPLLPVVVGTPGYFLSSEKYPFAEQVRQAIRQTPEQVTGVGLVDTRGLGHKGDHLHFSTAAQQEMGLRFAQAMKALQSPREVALWPEGRMPGKGANEAEADKPEKGDHVRRVTNVSRATLTVFPAKSDAAHPEGAPALIVCPGGGYSYVVVNKEGSEVAAWLNAAGYTALVLKYRTPNNRAGAFQDVQRALRVARTRAAEWNLDPKRLGVIGFSAGGHLSARASTAFGQASYEPVDAVDSQSCRPDFAVLVYPAYLAKDGVVNPDLDLKAEIPPTLIVHSLDDKTFIAGSQLYEQKLTEAGVTHRYLLYPTGGHGYALRCEREAKVWPGEALEWLKLTLGERP